jgi:hypothetical protein
MNALLDDLDVSMNTAAADPLCATTGRVTCNCEKPKR